MNDQKIISVFGSHAPAEGSLAYAQAHKLGSLLAISGFAVATGGYSGTMAAVSQGAAEAGGYVIGVTSSQIESFRGAQKNRWVQTEIKYPLLSERVKHLVENNVGMVVLPGGIGTLSEFALGWSLMQVKEIPLRPLVLIGELWEQTLKVFYTPEYIADTHLKMIRIVADAETAAKVIIDST